MAEESEREASLFEAAILRAFHDNDKSVLLMLDSFKVKALWRTPLRVLKGTNNDQVRGNEFLYC